MAFDGYVKANQIELEDKNVIDVGAGEGRPARTLLEERKLIYLGIDIKDSPSINMIKIPYPDKSFDIVFCCHAFEHCERPIDAMREFRRIVSDQGFIFISTPNPCHKQILAGDEDHIFCLDAMQMQKLLNYCDIEGLSFLQTENIKEPQDWNIITIGKRP